MNTTRLPLLMFRSASDKGAEKYQSGSCKRNIGCLVLLILMILIGCLFLNPAGMIFSSPALLLYKRAHHVSRPCGLYAPSRMDPRFFMKKIQRRKAEINVYRFIRVRQMRRFFRQEKAISSSACLPLCFWGAVLSVICCCLVPPQLFWGVYLIQASNIAGAAGDLYTTVILCRMPKEVLVYDFGASMFFSSACGQKKVRRYNPPYLFYTTTTESRQAAGLKSVCAPHNNRRAFLIVLFQRVQAFLF